MDIIKIICSQCGGQGEDLVHYNDNFLKCTYCGNLVSCTSNEKIDIDLALAYEYRQKGNFDEAKQKCKNIINIYGNSNYDISDAYWGLFLSSNYILY